MKAKHIGFLLIGLLVTIGAYLIFVKKPNATGPNSPAADTVPALDGKGIPLDPKVRSGSNKV